MLPGAQGACLFLCAGAVILHIWLSQALRDALRHPSWPFILVRRRGDSEHLPPTGRPSAPQDVPRWLKVAPDDARWVPDGPSWHPDCPSWFQDGPSWLLHGPSWPQDVPS